jgi:hypothetical protein
VASRVVFSPIELVSYLYSSISIYSNINEHANVTQFNVSQFAGLAVALVSPFEQTT